MYAVIETGGKQYRVNQGDIIKVEKLTADVGEKVDFDRVLLVGEGTDVKVGSPIVDGASVSGTVVEQDRHRKIIVFKMKRRKTYRRKQGHRQDFTRLQIKEIVTASGTFTAADVKPKPAAPRRCRKPKAEPVAEETPVTEAAAPEATAETPAAEATAETDTKPKRARPGTKCILPMALVW